jgi:hypothetical protein
MRRVALIGMNNPLSVSPSHALYPDPPNCTGWRVWQMLKARTGATQTDYLRTFHRYNLGTERNWRIERARQRWDDIADELEDNFDTIVLLGAAVREATGLRLPPIMFSRSVVTIPHPSGLNRWYNSDRNRQMIEIALEEMYVEATTS